MICFEKKQISIMEKTSSYDEVFSIERIKKRRARFETMQQASLQEFLQG